jgi:hypothetical protein
MSKTEPCIESMVRMMVDADAPTTRGTSSRLPPWQIRDLIAPHMVPDSSRPVHHHIDTSSKLCTL